MAVSSGGLAALDNGGDAASAPIIEDAPDGGGVRDDFEAQLAQLTVVEPGDGEDYDRRLFKHWVDADGDGCDTRVEVLIEESLVPVTRESTGCKVTAGEWHSLYDDKTITQPGKLDIDHMVPLKEAWRSTASTWTPEQREAYANDLDEPFALIAVTASTNRSKADKDPALWRPPDADTWCAYASAWVVVKLKWELTADSDEVAALRDMHATC